MWYRCLLHINTFFAITHYAREPAAAPQFCCCHAALLKTMVKGQHTRAAKAAKRADDVVQLELLRRARDYARGHGLGPHVTVGFRIFPSVTVNSLKNALGDKIKRLLDLRLATDVLTKAEEDALEEWIISSAHGKAPATNDDISKKVVTMLKARKADIKRRKHGPGTIALTEAEDRLATERGAFVSITWLSNFAAKHPKVRPMKERNADVTRTKKQNEGVVTKHFYGEYGVQASLEFHGHLDMVTKTIRDPRCIWWYDEMPQALDADNQGPRSKAWGVVGETLEKSGHVNRETASVGMAFNLAGFLAGPQFNVARENWTCALADCLEAPPWAKRFDNTIYSLDAKSTYCQMEKTANGVQTQESFLAYLRGFRKQVDAYSAAEVAAGRPPLPEPQWMGLDNHGSRFGPNVLEACGSIVEKDLNIRLFFEESKTSQFLQPPDQVTKACHGAYAKGKKQYKKLHKKVYGEEATIGIVEFIEIWGGCAELGYEGAWFSWITAQGILGAWRNCGWLGCLIAPEEIDRSSFIDQPATAAVAALLALGEAPTPVPLTYEQALQPPPGVRAGSLAAAQAVNEQLVAYINQNTHAPLDPVALGLLDPKVAVKKKGTRDKTQIEESEGGDAFLRDLAGSARAKQVRKAEAALQVEGRKQARIENKEEAAAAAVAQRAAFDKCKPVCTCGVVPCPQEKMQLCATCKEIKPHACRVRACVAARQPLLLTMREEPPALPAPAEAMEMAPGGELPVPLAQARPRRGAK